MTTTTRQNTSFLAAGTYADYRAVAAGILDLDLSGVMSDDYSVVLEAENAIYAAAHRLRTTFDDAQLDELRSFTKEQNPIPAHNVLVDWVFSLAAQEVHV